MFCRLGLMGFVLALGIAVPAAAQQTWPTRPLKLINPFPTGGPVDIVARVVALKIGERLGQQVVVENRPGASGAIGSEAVAHAPPDGYTLLIGSSATHAVSVSLYP